MAGLLKTNRCLWYMNLRDGGIVLGHLEMVFAIYEFFAMNRIWRTIYQPFQPEKDYTFEIIIAAISLAIIIMSICFLYGILKNKPGFLVPLLVFEIIRFCLFVFVAGLDFIFLLPDIALLRSGILFLYVALFWHAMAVVYSLHKEMKDESNSRPGVVYHQANTEPLHSANTMPQYQINVAPPNQTKTVPSHYPNPHIHVHVDR